MSPGQPQAGQLAGRVRSPATRRGASKPRGVNPELVYAPPPTPPGGVNAPAKGPGQPFSGVHGLGPTHPTTRKPRVSPGHSGEADPTRPKVYV